jgi:hypothetical protein
MKFDSLVGRKIAFVDGLSVGSERAEFICADGARFVMYHSQDCCESVEIADIVGNPIDLIGTVLDAREESGDTDPDGYLSADEYRESFTWTFYVIQTDRGAVTIRWLGESNGYYGETPYFEMTKEPTP